ncbi:MAG: flagellar assembly protein FliX [Rhodospirillales bacterium]
MKIVDPASIRGPAPVRRTARATGSGGAFARHLGETAEAGSASATGAAAAAAGLSGILSLQEADDRTASRRKAVARADTLLDKLDELRHGLLMGELTIGQLSELERLVASRRAGVDDPRLAAVLDEVDLRVQVEIAKYQANSGA